MDQSWTVLIYCEQIKSLSNWSHDEVVNSCPDPGLGYYPEGQGPDIKGKMVLG